jgi:hypothetical protein
MINATYHPTPLLMNLFSMNLMNHRSNPIYDLSFNIICSIRNNHCLTNPRFSRFPANKQLLNHASNDVIWSNVPTKHSSKLASTSSKIRPFSILSRLNETSTQLKFIFLNVNKCNRTLNNDDFIHHHWMIHFQQNESRQLNYNQ